MSSAGRKARDMIKGQSGNDEETTAEKLKRLQKKFKFDSHHSIQRFAIVSTAFALTGALVIGGASVGAYQSGQADIGTVALYTQEFKTSKTQQQGKVLGVYRNSDDTRALVLMKFAAPELMSSNANDYYVYAAGMDGGPESSPTSMAQPTAGSIYSFGSTGVIGVLLEAPSGFGEQIVNLTIRAKKELAQAPSSASGGGAQATSSPDNVTSFDKFDQWRIVLNPAASGAQETAALDTTATGDVDLRRIYANLVNVDEERNLRIEMNNSLQNMKNYLDRIDAVRQAMDTTVATVGTDRNVRMLPPALPPTMVDNSIDGMSEAELREKLSTIPADKIPGIADKTPTARMLDTWPNGQLPNTFDLASRTQVPGGLLFDWRSGSIYDGYLDKVVPGGQNPLDYLDSLAATPNENFTARGLTWPLSNGKTLNQVSSSSSGGTTNLLAFTDLQNRAIQAYQGFFDAKSQYERTQLWNLLRMEVTVDDVLSATTVATGTESVEFWGN